MRKAYNLYLLFLVNCYLIIAGKFVVLRFPIVSADFVELLNKPNSEKFNITNDLDLPKDFLDEVARNAEQLDKHMVWIAGGAISIFILFLNPSNLIDMSENSRKLLIIALITFSACLWLTITSFVLVLRIARSSKNVQKFTLLQIDISDKLNKMTEAEQIALVSNESLASLKRLEFECNWNMIRRFILESVGVIPRLIDFVNITAYIFFTIGIFSLIAFSLTLIVKIN